MQSSPVRAAALVAAESILSLALDQTRALYSERWDEFERLADCRTALLEALAHRPPAVQRSAVLDALARATAIDEQNRALLHALQMETERELRQLHQGHNALQGYGRPASSDPSFFARLNVTG